MTPVLRSVRRLLIVAPHPDDETIGAWKLMSQASRTGALIALIVVSDGGASHPGSVRWPQHRLIAARRRETIRAMRRLGLAPSSIRFLGQPDGRLRNDPSALLRAISRAVLRRPRVDLIVGPDPNDAHPDHAAVATALANVLRRGERRVGYHVWPATAQHGHRISRLQLDGREMSRKRQMVKSYRTQTGIITDARAGFALTHQQLKAFVRPIERFAVLT